MKQRVRLDQYLADQGLCDSRSKAQAAIMAGLVYVAGQKAEKPGMNVGEGVSVEVRGKPHPFVSRGGVKLEKALNEFPIDVAGRTALDVGASTGGFTDCLLQRGAAKVYAVDVGYGQLDWKLRNDPRVAVIERTNARNLTPGDLVPQSVPPTLAVIDVSFISLSKILPAVYNLLADKAEIIALIKPQFEAGKGKVGRGGVVRDEAVRQEVIAKVKTGAEGLGLKTKGLVQSPIEGADGNIEYLIWLGKG